MTSQTVRVLTSFALLTPGLSAGGGAASRVHLGCRRSSAGSVHPITIWGGGGLIVLANLQADADATQLFHD